MKKNILLTICLLFAATVAFSQADRIVGIWKPAKGTSQVRIFKATNGKYYGKVEWLKEDKDKLDVENPDPAKRNLKVWGLMILNDFSYSTDKSRWEGGTVYDPDNGKTYDCFMWFDGNDNNIMRLKGYVLGMKFVGRAEDWTREAELKKD